MIWDKIVNSLMEWNMNFDHLGQNAAALSPWLSFGGSLNWFENYYLLQGSFSYKLPADDALKGCQVASNVGDISQNSIMASTLLGSIIIFIPLTRYFTIILSNLLFMLPEKFSSSSPSWDVLRHSSTLCAFYFTIYMHFLVCYSSVWAANLGYDYHLIITFGWLLLLLGDNQLSLFIKMLNN